MLQDTQGSNTTIICLSIYHTLLSGTWKPQKAQLPEHLAVSCSYK
jgi:hypothetical protein